MELLYKPEHLSCFNYNKGTRERIELYKSSAGDTMNRTSSDTDIILLLEGSFKLSYGTMIEEKISKGKLMLFPPASSFRIDFTEDTKYIIFRVKGVAQLCECMSLERLNNEAAENVPEGFHTLNINGRIDEFTGLLMNCLNDGLKCAHYFKTKITELFFLLRAYYKKEELARFFSPLMGSDAQFMILIYNNYKQSGSVKELAEISNYSLSGFKKRFNKVFGVPPSEWLSNQKATRVFQDLNRSELNIKGIADKHGFSSLSAFSAFCQQKFGMPPGRIKLNAGKSGDSENTK